MIPKIVFIRKSKDEEEEGQGKEGMKNYSSWITEQII